MFDLVHAWLSEHPQALPLGLFAVAWVECFALIGVIVPGMWLLLSLCVLSSGLNLPLWQGILAIFLGGYVADLMSFHLGWAFSGKVHRLAQKKHFKSEFDRAHQFVEKWGWLAIPIGRFIGPVRPVMPLLSGALQMQKRKFYLIDALASATWAVAMTLPTWLLGDSIDLTQLPMDWILLASIVFVLALLVGGRFLQARQQPKDP